ncbi:MAG TPA: putative toxin-antitoxin system toxin component, PIN family [Tepidisphaeraceae bacterium]|nr:putative toxin-antitoxin system toxin component, PIN family [Tepidisphaeraceae bacterium]
MKVVLDTNVLLAALATHGLCESVLDVCLDSHELILSEHILAEVERNLRAKFKIPPQDARQFIQFLRQEANMVEPVAVPQDSCDDKDDLPVLGTAMAGSADCIVSGDKHLLKLINFKGIPIHSPRAFYDQLR